MAKIDRYKDLIKKEMQFHQNIDQTDQPGLSTELVMDKDENIFILLISGWHNNKYYHHIVFHICIEEDKIIIKEDNTDYIIADKLKLIGIPETDIICPYLTPPLPKDIKAAA